MQESKLINDLVGNKALKGFTWKNGHVVPYYRLTLDDNKALAEIIDNYGKSIKQQYNINKDIGKLIEESKGHLIIADILPGTLIRLELEARQQLNVVYSGGLSFYLCSDSAGILHPYDVLKAFTLELTINGEAYFQVLRDGSPYPGDNRLFKAIIRKITIFNSRIEGNLQCRRQVDDIKSKSKVYARQAEDMPPRFEEEMLTDDNHALFTLDLDNCTYEVNPSFNIKLCNDLAAKLKVACNVQHTGHGLHTKESGIFSMNEDGGGYYSFHITKKAEVEI
jgi:hypothetical protein